jgi:hypothetical protein
MWQSNLGIDYSEVREKVGEEKSSRILKGKNTEYAEWQWLPLAYIPS